MHTGILIMGLFRTAVWIMGAFMAYKVRRRMPFIAFSAAALVSGLFAFLNAGAVLPVGLAVATALSSPIAALFVIAFLTSQRHLGGHQQDWHD